MPKKANVIVKESNALARARIMPPTTSVWEERIISAIAARNRTDELSFREQIIKPWELSADGEINDAQFKKIKQCVKEVASKTFEIQVGQRGVMVYPIFSKLGVEDNGTIIGKFNFDLQEHYLELKKQFSMRSLPEFQALSSLYSQQLYRFLVSWRNEAMITVPLTELHSLVDSPPSLRKDFSLFRIRVLEVAHHEINAKTELEFDWEAVKEGKRKTVAVQFIFDLRAKHLAKAKEQLATVKKSLSAEDDELTRLQSESNACFEKLHVRLSKGCTPKKRSKRCTYCIERGRMHFKLQKTSADR